MEKTWITLDGNEACARVAYALNEAIAIYPITPASPMGEWADQWAARGLPNLWGEVPRVVEMQSEGGAAGAVHGALQGGALTTTFTASQGLLLMIPNMYKIAGELTPMAMHVAARSIAGQALSIFGDHSDVYAARATGFAMLCSGSVQEAQDLACIAHAAALEARVPFLHFFDGFRTSHEIAKIEALSPEHLKAMIDPSWIDAHRRRALTPDQPFIRGTAQNPDVFFQAREAVNPFYLACPRIVQNAMDRFAELTGRGYKLYEYHGAPDAERVLVLMGSGADTARATVDWLNAHGEKAGLLEVRLYRPFDAEAFLAALPSTVRRIAALDRTKEPGSLGEPLFLDTVAALAGDEGRFKQAPLVIGGRYGLSSKEFTPAMVKAVFDELAKDQPKRRFTVGIVDDVTHTSLTWNPDFDIEDPHTVRAIFYGLGSDGTVGANKNSIKIIGEETEGFAQGYFVYDSKKSGSVTVSHLRFGPNPIHAAYLVNKAGFVACHQQQFLERMDVLAAAEPGGVLLLNASHGPDEIWDRLPAAVRRGILEKNLKLYVIDAFATAREAGLGRRINTVMQTCFFAISGVLAKERAIALIKRAIEKTYGKQGPHVVARNHAAVDQALDRLHRVAIPKAAPPEATPVRPAMDESCPPLIAQLIAGEGERLPVSALPADGTFPIGTAQFEKRNIAEEIPVWDPDVCIQCGKCVLVCPHAVIRGKRYDAATLADAPEGFLSAPARWRDFKDQRYTLQVAPEDCTGCALCVEVCPAKNRRRPAFKAINMEPQAPLRKRERANWTFFEDIPEPDRAALNQAHVKDVQLLDPLFEFSGACAGCGETPYLKLLTQLFGDRMTVANATGCSSIYGGNLPTTPWRANRQGYGPAWSNSLFEDNAEFGMGMRLALDHRAARARTLLQQHAAELDESLAREILAADMRDDAGIAAQRARVDRLLAKLGPEPKGGLRDLAALAKDLVHKSVWIIGGDGWAYDIGYGGLDHALASGADINVLVLDTEVYSNTGGQMSKATPRAAVAKFAFGGKRAPKKDLARMAMTYGTVYVAAVAMGADDAHVIKAFREAEAYPGPSLIIAYSHCIAHGYNLVHGMDQQKAAVKSGYWPLFRYHPERAAAGGNPLQLDSKPPSIPFKSYAYNETRYTMLAHGMPEEAKSLLGEAQEDVNRRWAAYERLARQDTAAADAAEEAHHD